MKPEYISYRPRIASRFAHLLPPHRVVQALALEQFVVRARLDDAAALQHVDAVGVHHRRQPVRDQNRDRVRAFAATSRIVRLISSSVSESSDEVASSNTRSCGLRSSARAIDSRCFSPPETFTPPSPITVSSPLSARASKRLRRGLLQHLAGTPHRSHPGARTADSRGSIPENSCASCVTNPIRSRSSSRSTSSSASRCRRMSPVLRRVEPDQQLHERRLPRARRSDERDRLAALDAERDVAQRRRRRRSDAGS